MSILRLAGATLTLFLLSPLSVLADTLPYKDGVIPEKERGSQQLIPINTVKNTVYFEGFLLYYTDTRCHIVTRYKPPVCAGGKLNAGFFTRVQTKYGYVTVPEYAIPQIEQGQVSEHTFSVPGYFGPLAEAKVMLSVRANCVLQPVSTPDSTLPEEPSSPEKNPDLPPQKPLPVPDDNLSKPNVLPNSFVPLTQEEVFQKLIPAN